MYLHILRQRYNIYHLNIILHIFICTAHPKHCCHVLPCPVLIPCLIQFQPLVSSRIFNLNRLGAHCRGFFAAHSIAPGLRVLIFDQYAFVQGLPALFFS